MLYEFQVIYRLAFGGDGGLMPPVVVRAESAEQARQLVEREGILVHVVGPGLGFVSPSQEWMNKEEAAVYIRSKMVDNDSPSVIDKLMADGYLPKPSQKIPGRPLFRRRWLDAAICKRMGRPLEEAA